MHGELLLYNVSHDRERERETERERESTVAVLPTTGLREQPGNTLRPLKKTE